MRLPYCSGITSASEIAWDAVRIEQVGRQKQRRHGYNMSQGEDGPRAESLSVTRIERVSNREGPQEKKISSMYCRPIEG